MRFFCLLMACLVVASANWRNAVQQFNAEIFSVLDTNADGGINLEEATNSFLASDDNKDGIIEYTELQDNPNTPLHGNKDLLFNIFDLNNDRNLTQEDIVATFKEGDTNNDDVISLDELNRLALAVSA